MDDPAEAQVLDFHASLTAIVETTLPQAHGEDRVEAYLELNKLLRLEDTEDSVRWLRESAPQLLVQVHQDLRASTLRDVLHVALRTLSYFVFHKALATTLTRSQAAAFLDDVMSLLSATQDEVTYKLCLWCLTMQNLDVSTLNCFDRVLEGVVQAIFNPFQSRSIELQALRGVHAFLLKMPQELSRQNMLKVWWRPILGRLNSSDAATREAVLQVVKEATTFLTAHRLTSDDEQDVLTSSLVELALPTMKQWMDEKRNKEALQLWTLVLQLMRPSLAKDLTLLNALLYVPEISMRHQDATIRLMSIEAWRYVVDAFRLPMTVASKDVWVLKKPIVQLLMRPIVVCLEEETLRNVVRACIATWHTILRAATNDFNAFCDQQSNTAELMQLSAKKWKRWYDEMVSKVVQACLQHRYQSHTVVSEDVITCVEMVQQLWDQDSQEASETVGSSPTSDTRDRDLPPTKRQLTFDGSQSSPPNPDSASTLPHIGTSVIGSAFLLPDIISFLQRTLNWLGIQESPPPQVMSMADHVWRGFCSRLHALRVNTEDAQTKKLRLRLARLGLDFALGISNLASPSADSQAMSQSALDSSFAGQAPSCSSDGMALFPFPWQVRFMHALCAGFASVDELRGLFFHPKTKLNLHLLVRMRAQASASSDCAKVLECWEATHGTSAAIDLTARANVLPCTLLYLLIEYASSTSDHQARSLRLLVLKLVACAKADCTDSVNTHDRLLRFAERSVHVIARSEDEMEPASAMRELLSLSRQMVEHSDESQENAAILLDLHQNTRATAERPSSTATNALSAKREKKGAKASSSSGSSETNSMPSPCMLSSLEEQHANRKKAAPTVIDLVPESAPRSPEPLTIPSSEESLTISKPSTTADAPRTPTRGVLKNKNERLPEPKSPGSGGGLSAAVIAAAMNGPCIYQPLAKSTEPIASLYRHFPLAFRQFFTFYKIKTVGDLSSMRVDQIKAFGMKDPINTVLKALDEFHGRKERMKNLTNSPFRQRVAPQSPGTPTSRRPTTATPLSASPSPARPGKRLLTPQQQRLMGSSLSMDGSPQRKRPRRPIRELSSELEAAEHELEMDSQDKVPKIAGRVKFCLTTSDGESRITRPGEDSQDPNAVNSERDKSEQVRQEEHDDKMRTYSMKMIQHLQRSAHYADKILAEDESLQSDASLQGNAKRLQQVLSDFQHAHGVIARMSAQLEAVVKKNATQCEKLLQRR